MSSQLLLEGCQRSSWLSLSLILISSLNCSLASLYPCLFLPALSLAWIGLFSSWHLSLDTFISLLSHREWPRPLFQPLFLVTPGGLCAWESGNVLELCREGRCWLCPKAVGWPEQHCKRQPKSLQHSGLHFSSSVPTLLTFKMFYLSALTPLFVYIYIYTRARCNFWCAFLLIIVFRDFCWRGRDFVFCLLKSPFVFPQMKDIGYWKCGVFYRT